MTGSDAEVAEAEAEEAGDEVPEIEGSAVPSHEPFSFKVLSIASTQQSLNGLRHNDHLRYRQYCSRRLRRLYNVLRFKHGRGRYKPAPFPGDFQDIRYLEIPLVNAERAWSYGVQLKADNAAASEMKARWRHHSIQRFAKAVKWAKLLESVCKIHGDQRTQLEAEAYCSQLEGIWHLEKEEHEEALDKLKRCRRVCEHLGLASEQVEAPLFKSRAQSLAPMIRECKYNLGMDFDGDDADEDVVKPSSGPRRDLSELSYRGRGLTMPSDKIKAMLDKCLQTVSALKVGQEEESGAVVDKYGELSTEFGDVLKEIHTDMIAAGAEGQTDEWRMLEAFGRELSICMNVERNMMLLSNHLCKLDGLEEISSADARKICRPEEGMRFCDLLQEDLRSLQELPETDDEIAGTLATYVAAVMNYRCLFLALCYTVLGKSLEAASLLDMLHTRAESADLGASLQEPLARLHPLFERVHRGMTSRVGQWRCRGLARLCFEDVSPPADQNKTPVQEDFGGLTTFPPRYRDIPCKPLLFDLAFNTIQQPDIDELLPKAGRQSGVEGEKKGLLRSVTGGIAGGIGRLGGLWGRK